MSPFGSCRVLIIIVVFARKTALGGSLIPPACREFHNCGSLIPPMRSDATIGVAYYPVMAQMPQWELPHTKVEQAHRTAGLLYKDFLFCIKNREVIIRAFPFGCFDIPLQVLLRLPTCLMRPVLGNDLET